ncbi:Iron-regulated transcriptional activator AFT2 [Candida viswanathii]|uniref:Iron-regulated transcriptional activator AFT2 n=1 Tax=Candida viswanathii TaxID=5486 RepID=A0A367YM81_9ASCO|nr:Iron-regulated transcriptional activator AFT2 [Candida viswanathii]
MTDRVIHRVALDDLQLGNQKFNSKDDIKPWLQTALLQNKGIDIVIERSDTTKIIFRCKNNVKEKRIVRSKRKDTKIPVRKHTTCPFKVRANYSVRNKVWTLLTVCDKHDHPVDPPGSQAHLPQGSDNASKDASSAALSASSSTGPMEVETNDPTTDSSTAAFMNSKESPKLKSKSPTIRKTNSRGSKNSASSSARSSQSSQRNSTSGYPSQANSAATSVDDLKNIQAQPLQGPTLPASLPSSNSFPGTNVLPTSQHATAPKRRKSVPNTLPKVRKLKDNITNISPIQEDPNVNSGFVVPGVELQQLQSLHPNLPQPRANLDHHNHNHHPHSQHLQPPQPLPQPGQTFQQEKQSQQPRQPRQRGIQQIQLPPKQPSPQQQQQQQQQQQLDGSQQQQHQQGEGQQGQSRILQSRSVDQFLIVNILQTLQGFVRDKVKEEILDNKNLHDNMKTDMLDSFVSQIILDYRHMLSPQFLYSLKQNFYDRRNISDPLSDLGQGEGDQAAQAPQYAPMRKGNAPQIWLPSVPPGVGGSIPLSPLLNDSDTSEYVVGPNASNQNPGAGQSNPLDNLTHLPGISSTTFNYIMQMPLPSTSLLHTSNSGNSSNQQFAQSQPPPLMPPLQTQGQQLPPLETIQKFPPQGNPNATSQGTLPPPPPPLNNAGSTLNPSSLLKTTKSNNNTAAAANNTSFNSFFQNPSATNPAFLLNSNTGTGGGNNASGSNNPTVGNATKDGTSNNSSNNMLNNMPSYDSAW